MGGKDKRSKTKMCKNIKLSWGATEFKLPGIQFTTNLENIVSPQKTMSLYWGK